MRYLAWKDNSGGGKTQVHLVECEFLGRQGQFACSFPVRLAAGSVKRIIVKPKSIFIQFGRGDSWDVRLEVGNPACAPSVQTYLKGVADEQA